MSVLKTWLYIYLTNSVFNLAENMAEENIVNQPKSVRKKKLKQNSKWRIFNRFKGIQVAFRIAERLQVASHNHWD